MTKKNSLKSLTVDDIGQYETQALVNSPRSVEACLREGIEPQDLIYVPEEAFHLNGISHDVKHLHYQFIEAKRKEMLFKVRKTRKKIIFELETATRCSTAFPGFQLKLNKSLEKTKAVKIKAIDEFVNREKLMHQILKQREAERLFKMEKAASQSIAEAENVKKRYEKTRELYIEKQKKAKKDAKDNELLAKYIYDKEIKENQKLIELQQQKLNYIENKKRVHELKTKNYQQNMQERFEKIQKLRQLNLVESDLKQKEIRQKIIIEKERKQKILEDLWNFKMKKKEDLKNKIKSEIKRRQVSYYKLKQITDLKSEELYKLNNKPKCLSLQNSQFLVIKDQIDSELEFKKEKNYNKRKNSEIRQEKLQQAEKKKLNLNKSINNIRHLKHSWNIQRIKNRIKHENSLLAQKYKMKYDNLSELELNKTETIKKKLKSEIDEELKYQELDKAMIQMSINKAWDKKKLIQIIEPLDEYEKK